MKELRVTSFESKCILLLIEDKELHNIVLKLIITKTFFLFFPKVMDMGFQGKAH